MPDKLDACPYCGDDQSLDVSELPDCGGHVEYAVFCGNCGAAGPCTGKHARAAVLWNGRKGALDVAVLAMEQRALRAECEAKNWRYAFEMKWGADLAERLHAVEVELASVRAAWATCKALKCCSVLCPPAEEVARA